MSQYPTLIFHKTVRFLPNVYAEGVFRENNSRKKSQNENGQ